MIDKLSSFDSPFTLLVIIAGAAYLRDFSGWKWIKNSLVSIALAGMIYRLHHPQSPSILEWLLAQLPTHPTFISIAIKDLLGLTFLYVSIQSVRYLRRSTWSEWKASIGDTVFRLAKNIPSVQQKLQEEAVKSKASLSTSLPDGSIHPKDPYEEADKLEASLEHSLRPHGWIDPIKTLPSKGRSASEILTQLKGFNKEEEVKWKEGYVSGAVYSGEEELIQLMGEASSLYGLTNPLHPDLFPSLMKFEAEICSMVTNLVNGGDKNVVASLTSGGTESIILAAKSHRDYYRAEKGIHGPEIIACVSAHAAIYKAADLMSIRLVLVPMDPQTYQVDLSAMEAAITSNTILLYASVPTFSQGVIDPISAISKLGLKYGIGVHVDCCLGGFILPFAKKLSGYDIPDFDFSLPGVTSMSVDTHKYGYASKGTSVVVYRNKQLRRYQYFCFSNWPGGLYVTPTIAGSRPGALSAACWAAMVNIGEEGYLQRTKKILHTAHLIAKGVERIPGLCLQGKVQAMIVCIGGQEGTGVNIYDIGDLMTKKGWNLNSLQNPAGLHLCCTLRHVGKGEKFLSDLKEAAEEVMERIERGEQGKSTGNAAIYGMAATLPAGPINEMLRTYTDVVLKMEVDG